MVYKAMFPRNLQPELITDLLEKFKNVQDVHDLVRAQMIAGAKFPLI
jgi:hypothetical protein